MKNLITFKIKSILFKIINYKAQANIKFEITNYLNLYLFQKFLLL